MRRWRLILAALVFAAVVLCAGLLCADTMYWQGDFTDIVLSPISTMADVVTGSGTATLITDSHCEISADNSTAARLVGPGGDVLTTEYSLSMDGNGTSATGGPSVNWTPYDSFLDISAIVTHVGSDNQVVVTLGARASIPSGGAPNAGAYSATQTLTVSWTGEAPPAAPTDLDATVVNDYRIDLAWSDNSSNETGFRIERKTGVGGSWAQIDTVGDDVVGYQNTGLDPNTTYYYRVRAYNAAGNSDYSNEDYAATTYTTPAAPSSLTATAAGTNQINLSWTDNSYNETGFRIERKTGSGGSWAEIDTVDAGVTTYQNTGLVRNTTYFYRVRAYNYAGDSDYSNEANATTDLGDGDGLKGDYYDTMFLTDLKLSRTDSTVNFDWASGSPDPSIDPEEFSVRWTGYVRPRYSETYTFTTWSDDGNRLWVNGVQITNDWSVQHGTKTNSGTIALTANQLYVITFEYYEDAGNASVWLKWSSASQAQEIVPTSRLYTP